MLQGGLGMQECTVFIAHFIARAGLEAWGLHQGLNKHSLSQDLTYRPVGNVIHKTPYLALVLFISYLFICQKYKDKPVIPCENYLLWNEISMAGSSFLYHVVLGINGVFPCLAACPGAWSLLRSVLLERGKVSKPMYASNIIWFFNLSFSVPMSLPKIHKGGPFCQHNS